VEYEGRSISKLGNHRKTAVEINCNLFTYTESEAIALSVHAVADLVPRLEKRLEQICLVTFWNTDSLVLNAHDKVYICWRSFLGAHFDDDFDRALTFWELQSICEQIDEYLLNTKLVQHKIFKTNVVRLDNDVNFGVLGLNFDYI